MKKLLLLSALALGAMSASAQSFGDYFKVTFEGKEVTNGETITVTTPEYSDEWGDAWAAHIGVINLENEFRPVYGEAVYVKPATKSELLSEENGARAQICFSGAHNGLGNCLGNGNEYQLGSTFVNIPAAGVDTFEWAVDLNYDMANLKNPVTMKLNMFAANGDGEDQSSCEIIDGTEFTVTIVFGDEGGVDAIGTENGAAEYFNLQGVRVANPEKGLYIVKQGGKVTKRVF